MREVRVRAIHNAPAGRVRVVPAGRMCAVTIGEDREALAVQLPPCRAPRGARSSRFKPGELEVQLAVDGLTAVWVASIEATCRAAAAPLAPKGFAGAWRSALSQAEFGGQALKVKLKPEGRTFAGAGRARGEPADVLAAGATLHVAVRATCLYFIPAEEGASGGGGSYGVSWAIVQALREDAPPGLSPAPAGGGAGGKRPRPPGGGEGCTILDWDD